MRRAGLSLVEVIVAMFIMALGMIALLTLFPLGALQIGQALKDDRCAQAGAAADNILRTHWKKYVTEQTASNRDPFTRAFADPQDPSYGAMNSTKSVTPNDPNSMPVLLAGDEPSYPVYIDPRGFRARAVGTYIRQQFWMAETILSTAPKTPRIPRRSLKTVELDLPPSKIDPYRIATLLDDLTYNDNGSANRLDSNNSQLPIERQGRYTWAWMVQLPALGNPNFANMSVVVYDSRNPDYPAADEEMVYGNVRSSEPTAAVFTVGSTSATFTYGPNDAVPNIRAGSWILDGTSWAILPSGNAYQVRLANFYRVTGFEIDETTRTVRLDLQTPIKPLPGVAGLPANITTYYGDLYVMKGVVEVFERRPLVANDVPQ
jgi:hypothetical protein